MSNYAKDEIELNVKTGRACHGIWSRYVADSLETSLPLIWIYHPEATNWFLNRHQTKRNQLDEHREFPLKNQRSSKHGLNSSYGGFHKWRIPNGSTWMVYSGTSYENGWFRWFRGTPMTGNLHHSCHGENLGWSSLHVEFGTTGGVWMPIIRWMAISHISYNI